MLTIWGRDNSSNVKKVLWCVEELGLPYEHIPAGGAFGLVNEPEYRALNPNGLVPTVRDGDLVLWESNAVVRYLVARYADATLLTTDVGARAKADRWMDWATSNFSAPFRDVFWNMVRTAPEKRDMAAVDAGIVRCGKLLTIVDDALAGQPYLSGTEIGIGDIPLGCAIHSWFAMQIERPSTPHVEAWYNRLLERPAYRKVVAKPLT